MVYHIHKSALSFGISVHKFQSQLCSPFAAKYLYSIYLILLHHFYTKNVIYTYNVGKTIKQSSGIKLYKFKCTQATIVLKANKCKSETC